MINSVIINARHRGTAQKTKRGQSAVSLDFAPSFPKRYSKRQWAKLSNEEKRMISEKRRVAREWREKQWKREMAGKIYV